MNKTKFNSAFYWDNRYRKGGNSGAGSFGRLAEFKADIINTFVRDNNINNVIEFGCGDGAQLDLYEIPHYVGVDVSEFVLDKCLEKYDSDKNKIFCLGSTDLTGELSMSIDVIYHLLENDVYDRYMRDLFGASSKWVIIYATNSPFIKNKAEHIKHRWFTEWVKHNRPDFILKNVIKNKYPYKGDVKTGSHCDFYIYEKQ